MADTEAVWSASLSGSEPAAECLSPVSSANTLKDLDQNDGNLRETAITAITTALTAASYSYCAGRTHAFYHYPARFSPQIATAIVQAFSDSGDLVLDPFMGGGTTVIEGLALGRQVLGVDINALAHFVTEVRTTPLSPADEAVVRDWARDCALLFGGPDPDVVDRPRIRNLPAAVEVFMAGSLSRAATLRFPRQRVFARCALLRLGQWAMDCRDFKVVRRRMLATRLPELVGEMLTGLHDFVEACRDSGLNKSWITGNRVLLHRNAVGLETDRTAIQLKRKARLVFTSPPYPKVHVLYHRWQYRGRKETAAPYWIAEVPDGFTASHYTGGSRTPTGLRNYFAMIKNAFSSVRAMVTDDAVVAQLVGFADAEAHLPEYLRAMSEAGFIEIRPVADRDGRLGRRVPNRKWYAEIRGHLDASAEVLLLHRPR